MRVLFEKRVHEGLSRDNDTILAALNGGLAWHRRRKAKLEAGRAEAERALSPSDRTPKLGREPADQSRMTLDGIAAVQARIQEIEQQVVGARAPATAATTAIGRHDRRRLRVAADRRDEHAGRRAGIGDSTDADRRDRDSSGSSGLLSDLVSSLTGSGAAGATAGTATSPDITSLLSSLTGSGTRRALRRRPTSRRCSPASPDRPPRPAPTSTLGATPNATTQQFVDTALGQQGKPYVWGVDRVADRSRTRRRSTAPSSRSGRRRARA